MPRRAFTLIEVMAVVVLIGLLAAATTWSLAGDLRRSSLQGTIGQISHADNLTRMTALNTARPCVLRFDLDRQTMQRITQSEGRDEAGHLANLPENYRVECVWLAPSFSADRPSSGAAQGLRFVSGDVDIAYSTNGLSLSYAVALAARDGSDKGLLVFSGLTGQATWIHDQREMDNLLALLAAGRPDAH